MSCVYAWVVVLVFDLILYFAWCACVLFGFCCVCLGLVAFVVCFAVFGLLGCSWVFVLIYFVGCVYYLCLLSTSDLFI